MIKRGGAGLKFDNDFFNTEVREGFEISSMMKRAWAAQMEVFQVVSDICNRNGIRYFADFGTLLGAVRHKGMIPWDDDIDLAMMRPDFERLEQLLAKHDNRLEKYRYSPVEKQIIPDAPSADPPARK